MFVFVVGLAVWGAICLSERRGWQQPTTLTIAIEEGGESDNGEMIPRCASSPTRSVMTANNARTWTMPGLHFEPVKCKPITVETANPPFNRVNNLFTICQQRRPLLD